MAPKQAMHMNPGYEETSYARNSGIQSSEHKRIRPLIEAAISELCGSTSTSTLLPAKMVIADLGCSSGPNALALVLIATKAIHKHCLELQQPPPEVCVLLNDLPENDFNTVVKSLATLRQSKEHVVVVTGVVPGSFYERLFTSGSIHLICSSNSLHWLSKAPEDLTKNQIPAYDFDELARRERLPMVAEAYARQFRKDFTVFLQMRAKEMVPGGRMIVSLLGRRSGAPTAEFFHVWEIITQVLSAMVSEGVIDKDKFNSFYVPLYAPLDEEVRAIVKEEGSFSIKEIRLHNFLSGVDKALITPNVIRAIYEPMIVHHFGGVMDEFMRIADRLWRVEGRLLQDYFIEHPQDMLVASLYKG